MTDSREVELIIVGAGVAGCTAALYAKRYGIDVVMLDRGVAGGQLLTAPLIENYPGFPEGISGTELSQRVHQQVENYDIEIIQQEATDISRHDDGRWLVQTNNGEWLTVAVIIATGVVPRSLNVPGEEELRGRGVSYCATCDGFLFRGETVAVVGGGNAAVEDAMYLADICEKVYLIHRRDRLRADSYLGQQVIEGGNIEPLWNTVVQEIIGAEEVEQLKLRNTQTDAEWLLPVTGVFVAIGEIAHTDWLEDLLELDNGFIRTDMSMRTNQPGIFAAGDIRDTVIRQVTTAVGDATIAAYSAYQYIAQHRGEVYGEYAGPE